VTKWPVTSPDPNSPSTFDPLENPMPTPTSVPTGSLSDLNWRNASDTANSCVDVALDDALVRVRDSKDPDGPTLSFDLRAWRLTLSAVRAYSYPPGTFTGPNGVTWQRDGVERRFTWAEWDAFAAGVKRGDFDLERLAVATWDGGPVPGTRPILSTVDPADAVEVDDRLAGLSPVEAYERGRVDERAKVQAEMDAEWRQRVREHLGRAALAALRCVPDGEIRVGCVVHDGAAVRERLRLGYLSLTREAAQMAVDGSGVPVPLGTPSSVADGDAGPVSDALLAKPDPVLDAERLARARHRLAADSPFNPVPPWEHLTDHERELSILDAANYLKALDDAGYEVLPATFRAGYAEAVDRLWDYARYRNWWTAHPDQQFGTAYWAPDGRRHLADYLDTVGPDGPDVTSAAREEG
jgi:hypothetical protein